MNYYKVNADSNDVRLKKGYCLVANELLTKGDLKKMGATELIITKCTTPVVLSSRKTYFFFGARFAAKN